MRLSTWLPLSLSRVDGAFGISVLCAAIGCGPATMSAATLRVLDEKMEVSVSQPICFMPPESNLGLTEKAHRKHALEICESAAKSQGVVVVSHSSRNCAVATMTWISTDTGSRESECTRKFLGSAECESDALFQKTLRIAVADPKSGRPLLESTAALHSTFSAFTDKSFVALCTAAFREYPKPLQGEEFEVESE